MSTEVLVFRHAGHHEPHDADPRPPRQRLERKLEELREEAWSHRPPGAERSQRPARDLGRCLGHAHLHVRALAAAALDWTRRDREDVNACAGEFLPETLRESLPKVYASAATARKLRSIITSLAFRSEPRNGPEVPKPAAATSKPTLG